VFDFDGDGRAEVVYADQCFMRVYDGRNGDVLFSVPRSSTTRWEYPVVADVDGDTKSEIVTGSNDNDVTVVCPANDPLHPSTAFEPTHGVTVWKEPNDNWQGSRPIWNQHTYYVSHVNDDGKIPATFATPSNWDPARNAHNTFRQNTQGETGSSLAFPDLTTAGNPEYICYPGFDFATISGRICNRGMLAIEEGDAKLILARADSLTTTLCETDNSRRLEPSQCADFSCDIDVQRNGAPFDVRIVADPGQDVVECSDANNWSLISSVRCIDVPIR
jgi:hypothetical protein